MENNMEHESMKYLKIVNRLPLGGLILAHFMTAAAEAPDYILRRDGGARNVQEWEFAPTLGTVKLATREEVAAWPGRDRGEPIEHLVALLDQDGNILLQDYRSGQEAQNLMQHGLSWIRPFQRALLTLHYWMNCPSAIEEAHRTGLIYQVGHDLETGL
jgi:hypothetical protein